eukprot:gnl/TRDRNA2_/TRDRNA2_174350_c8_seq5.p1 gnl/TRDRNA2_/TRDRNA2_174350_c8~~gnl/TRDRNA2_/TRDRNA2_174350_c8_seq5.p1  ORF type:complete len:1071 (+),score=162.67 gnl/TRDRNA2_/TRDRNA2_174350_c8_seq5:166-3378(+)
MAVVDAKLHELPELSEVPGFCRRVSAPSILESPKTVQDLSVATEEPTSTVSASSPPDASVPRSPSSALPSHPVMLFHDGEDPSTRRLVVQCSGKVSYPLFKVGEFLTNHSLDIMTAEVYTEGDRGFITVDLRAPRPSDMGQWSEWCKELEGFVRQADTGEAAEAAADPEASLLAMSQMLSVNPDLISVASFELLSSCSEGTKEKEIGLAAETEYRYRLELHGINQAGLLTYATLVLLRSGFNILCASITTDAGHISDVFELATHSAEAERVLRSYFDVPIRAQRKGTMTLPFSATRADEGHKALVSMWGQMDPARAFGRDSRSRTDSWDDLDLCRHSERASSKESLGLGRGRVDSWDDLSSLADDGPRRGMSSSSIQNSVDAPQRSRFSSNLSNASDPCEQACSPTRLKGANVDGESYSQASPSSSSGSPSPGGHANAGHPSTGKMRRKTYCFGNGDVYDGSCVLFDTGEKRHGFGTYVYSPGTHEQYRQYRGQWREDRKHGYGVLFYSSGGVYVGQWENNDKNGLGILLDNEDDQDINSLPSLRYEGLWQQGKPHGLGAQESEKRCCYGGFCDGELRGRGVQLGFEGCEVMDGDGKLVPLMDALEAETLVLLKVGIGRVTVCLSGQVAGGSEDRDSEGWPTMSESSDAPPKPPKPTRDPSRGWPAKKPLVWNEVDIAAFLACLGISYEVCLRVMEQNLKGVGHLLEMTNSQMRRKFGLRHPVERIVVRHSLKRLLEVDRWKNGENLQKPTDILSDSVLSRFVVSREHVRIRDKFAHGAYGVVYRGVLDSSVVYASQRNDHSRMVAVKEMEGECRVSLYELLKEACVMASLNHVNICTFVGVCVDPSAQKHYIISELMDCSLFELVHRRKKLRAKLRWHGELTLELVLSLAKGISAGIAHMHAKNLVHADLKSSNILIDHSTTWKLTPCICDFGHATVRTFSSPHRLCGTPQWAAPEVLRREAIGPAADIYSVGAMIWEMLARKVPHRGLSFGQISAAVGWAGWTLDLSILPSIPSELQQLLQECLSFAPTQRPVGKALQPRLELIEAPSPSRCSTCRILRKIFAVCSDR